MACFYPTFSIHTRYNYYIHCMRKQVSSFIRHPWHGVSAGDQAPDIVTAYIEIVPGDTIKYEIDKSSGLLKIDRPQAFTNTFPGMYGFVPSTYCGAGAGAYAGCVTNREGIQGDGDPLDICIITEKQIPRNGILLQAVPIGGFRLLDKNEADDKIIAVLKGDEVYSAYTDLSQLPEGVVNRLKHYFLTYKDMPGETIRKNEIAGVYGREEAQKVIRICMADYAAHYVVAD
jgi:inorganic pyrophosphatase